MAFHHRGRTEESLSSLLWQHGVCYLNSKDVVVSDYRLLCRSDLFLCVSLSTALPGCRECFFVVISLNSLTLAALAESCAQ